MNSKILLYFVTFLTIFAHNAFSAKILGLFPFGGKSHFIVVKVLMTELSKRGHEVTMISNYHIDEPLENFTEILIEPGYEYWKDVSDHFSVKSVLELSDMSVSQAFDMVYLIGVKTTEYALQNPKVQEFIHNTDQHFDLVITEQFFNEAFLAIPYKLKVPVVIVATANLDSYMTARLGMINSYAHLPLLYLPYSDRMTFLERLKNTYWALIAEYKRHFQYFPRQDELVRKYFAHYGEPIPPVAELEKNISLLLANSHVPLDYSRPYVMGLVPVGGFYIRPPKSLPKGLKTFIDDSHKGVIYMNLGTNVQSSDMSPETTQAFLNVFSRLKQRVIWKWEDENIENKPKNVLVKKWFPQSDILAHPYVRVFITHGGLLSIQEAVYRNVPLIGIPIYCDQHANVERATRGGFGVKLDFKNLTEASITWALQQLLHESSYAVEMRKASQIFRDRPLSSLETAIYWVEYVIKYKGAQHIKSSAVYIPWYSLYLLDIIVFLITIVVGFIGLLYAVFKVRSLIKPKTKEKLYYKLN